MKTVAWSAVLLLTGCGTPNARVVTRLNTEASLAGATPLDPLKWNVITLGADGGDSTMFTLFGNDIAIRHGGINTEREYPAGTKLALATWSQQEDSRWFGGRIPASLRSVELVTVDMSADGKRSYSYQAFDGSPLKERTTLQDEANERVAHLLSYRAAVMP